MLNSVESLINLLETYRGRDKVVRTLCYGSQLVGGVLAGKNSNSSLGKSLLLFSAQLSHCRTTLRLFDDLSMLGYSASYGIGSAKEDALMRWMSVLNNIADQLYYPCEHIAWAADAEIIKTKSEKWWVLSTGLWGVSLVLNILRSFRLIATLQKKLQRHQNSTSPSERKDVFALQSEIRREVLSVLGSLLDLSNAVHWMPPGFLWAGLFPPWLVGLMGTISSLISLLQSCSTNQATSS